MQEDYTGLGATAWEGYASDPNEKIHPDLPMWREMAATTEGPILDIGCATGRVLIPLLEAGCDADGSYGTTGNQYRETVQRTGDNRPGPISPSGDR